MLQHQIVAALRAFFVEWNIALLLLAADALGGLAIRISGTGVELPEAACLESLKCAVCKGFGRCVVNWG